MDGCVSGEDSGTSGEDIRSLSTLWESVRPAGQIGTQWDRRRPRGTLQMQRDDWDRWGSDETDRILGVDVCGCGCGCGYVWTGVCVAVVVGVGGWM